MLWLGTQVALFWFLDPMIQEYDTQVALYVDVYLIADCVISNKNEVGVQTSQMEMLPVGVLIGPMFSLEKKGLKTEEEGTEEVKSKDYKVHRDEIHTKLVQIMRERVFFHLRGLPHIVES